MARKFDYKFIMLERDGSATVKGVIIGGYPAYSVLAGQDMICFIKSYDSPEDAQAAYPDAQFHNGWTAPRNYDNHLPDEPDY